jgi:hypothetical protein
MRRCANTTLATRGTPAQGRHAGARTGLVKKHQVGRVPRALIVLPLTARLLHIFTLLL